MPPMLEVHRVVQRFDGGAAVHGVSPSLEPAPASTASSAPMAPAFSDGQQEPGDFVPVLMTDPDVILPDGPAAGSIARGQRAAGRGST